MDSKKAWNEFYLRDERWAISGYSSTFKDIGQFLEDQWKGGHALLNLLGVKKGMKILDVGCGSAGLVVIPAAMKKTSVTGVDLSSVALNLLWKRVEEKGLEKFVTLHLKDVTQGLDLADETFDGVISMSTIMHIEECQKALNELSRVTRNGGWTFITGLLNKFHLDAIQYRSTIWISTQLKKLLPSLTWAPIPIYYHSLSEVKAMFKRAKLRIKKITIFHSIPLLFPWNVPYPQFIKKHMFIVSTKLPFLAREWQILAEKC